VNKAAHRKEGAGKDDEENSFFQLPISSYGFPVQAPFIEKALMVIFARILRYVDKNG